MPPIWQHCPVGTPLPPPAPPPHPHPAPPQGEFPGGGLEWGEGTIECLKREFIEEMELDIEVLEHFYTTDFFVQSDFNNEVQVMNVFYKVSTASPEKIKVSPFGTMPNETHNAAVFMWINKSEIHPDLFTYPIEKRVAELLSQEIKL